jgi:DNA repair protein RadC
MNLQFLASIGLIPVHVNGLEKNIQLISSVDSAKEFAAERDQVISGLFRHKEKKEIFALFSKKSQKTEVILAIIKDETLLKGITLVIGKVDDDIEMQQEIFKLFIERNSH